MRNLKKIFVIILVLTSLFSTFANAEEANANIDKNITQIISELISVTQNEPETYGLGGVDYDSLELMQSINPYKLSKKGTLQKIDDIEYFLLKADNEYVGVFTVCYTDTDDYSVSFDNHFVKELSKYVKKDSDKFLLIHDNGDLVLKTKKSVARIASSIGSDKVTINDKKFVKNDIELSGLQSTGLIKFTPVTMRSSTYKRIDMLYVPQGNYELCWAAATASLGHYYKGITKTAKYVADDQGIGYNDGGTALDMDSALNSIYNKDLTAVAAILSISDYITCIDNDIPVGAAFDGGTTTAHMVVLCGYSYGSQGIVGIVRDSNYSSYRLVYESSSNTFKMDYYTGGTKYWVNSIL